ncbi:MAG: sirohydrochlorin chelatase [Geodermatophilaceae bacterium]|nr:sirohydrochlorin chelatase [Geodermatophilaceae bacterium]
MPQLNSIQVPLPARRRTRPVLLATAHGSRDPRAGEVLDRLVHRIRSLAPDTDVRQSYVDHMSPSISQALSSLGEEAASAVVLPLLLSAAAHSKGDIPGAIAAARVRHPGLRISYGRVLGPHALLVEALQQQLTASGVAPESAIVLAGAGSTDPDANGEVAKVARLLWEVRRAGPVEVGFASATGPTVSEAVSRVRRLGYEPIAVAAYFLAPGRLLDSVATAAAGVKLTEPLGDTDAVARLVLERYAEALAGQARMNCDCCVYRTPWPGHEQRVGALQRPHQHPEQHR